MSSLPLGRLKIDGRGEAAVTPLVAVWLGDANQNVILTTSCNDWERGVDVVVEGEAVQVVDERVLERLAEAWAQKWDGRWRYEVNRRGFRHEAGRGAVLVFEVKPAKVFAFAKGTFGQTRHRFSVPER